jgi:hypothetical protein
MSPVARCFVGPLVMVALACSTNPEVVSSGAGGNGNAGGRNGHEPDKLPPAGTPLGGSGGAGGNGSDPFGGKTCGQKKYVLERKAARLLLVLDRSGSMQESIGQGMGDKWTAATGAAQEVIMKTQMAVQWGLKTFPGDIECTVTDGVAVPIAATNFPPIQTAVGMTTPEGTGTPTAAAIRGAAAYLKTLPDGPPRYLVLATDGQPNCMDGMSSQLSDEPGAVAAIAEAAAMGFPTFVIGVAIGGSMANDTLNMMAVAGKQPRAGDPRYYAATSREDLVSSLDLITGTVSNCVFPLDMKPPAPESVAVSVNGTRVQRDTSHMNGWDYATDSSVQLYGAACDAVKSKAKPDVQIIFGCPGEIIQ